MKSYVVKFSDREEGPYDETQMAQMFADGRIDRNTPCKPVSGGEWKMIDDYLPMLKYGTQLPPPAKVPAVPPMPPPAVLLSSQRVSVVDFDIPFGSVLKIMFKMDGSRARCVLLLLAGHLCSLANCGGDIRGSFQRRDVHFSSPVIQPQSLLAG